MVGFIDGACVDEAPAPPPAAADDDDEGEAQSSDDILSNWFEEQYTDEFARFVSSFESFGSGLEEESVIAALCLTEVYYLMSTYNLI